MHACVGGASGPRKHYGYTMDTMDSLDQTNRTPTDTDLAPTTVRLSSGQCQSLLGHFNVTVDALSGRPGPGTSTSTGTTTTTTTTTPGAAVSAIARGHIEQLVFHELGDLTLAVLGCQQRTVANEEQTTEHKAVRARS